MSSQKKDSSGMAAVRNNISLELLLQLYERMLAIRMFEDKIHQAFQQGLVYGTTHLCQGQEATATGAVCTLREDDYLTYTYRGHGTVIARGLPAETAFAEIFGRESGCSRGLGGSMHLASIELGLLGSFAIVGAGLPVAAGAAISAQLNGRGQVAMTFFGDGSTNIGAFHETMNLASVWKLPLVFVCENNLYGEYSPILSTTPFETLARRADAYGMANRVVDGNDVCAVYNAVSEAVSVARRNEGPTFVECKTYRYRGHSRSDPATYRPKGELETWVAKDPIPRCERLLREEYAISDAHLSRVREGTKAATEKAYEIAANAPWPIVRDLSDETLKPVIYHGA